MTERPEFSRRTHVAELIAVAAIVFVIVMGTAHIEPEGAERGVDALAYVCGIGGALSLLLWRRAPAVMVGIVAVAIFTYFARSYPPGPALLPGPISLVLLGLRAKRAVAWTGAIVMWAAVTLGLTVGDGRGDRLALAAVGWTLAAVFAGQLVAARRERIVADRERRRLTEYQAVTDERLRIAQDLHDSVAHAMATINVQAGTAAHLLARRPDQIDQQQLGTALTAIRTASAEVLDELGAILGLLRGWRRPDERRRAAAAGRARTARRPRRPRPCRRAGGDRERRGNQATTLPVPISTAAYRVRPGGAQQCPPPRRAGRTRGGARLASADDGAVRVEVVDDGGDVAGRGGEQPGGRSWRTGQGGFRPRRDARARRRHRWAARGGAGGGRRFQGGRRVAGPVIRVVLADDQILVRSGFRALLDAEDDITVVGEASDGAEALDVCRELQPDLVLMDIRMPGVDGLTATRQISEDRRLDGVRVLILTTFEIDEYVYEALRAGASGFLVKHTEPAELIRAVRVVAAGESLLSPGATRRLIAAFVDSGAGADARTGAAARGERVDGARARGRRPRRRRAVERGDRPAMGREQRDGAHPRQPGDDEAAGSRSGPARRVRLPLRAGGDPARRLSDRCAGGGAGTVSGVRSGVAELGAANP